MSAIEGNAAEPCPIRSRKLGKYRRKLYDHSVCRKCASAFANRRIMAFLLDAPLILVGNLFALAFVLWTVSFLVPALIAWIANGGIAVISLASISLAFMSRDVLLGRGRSPAKALFGLRTYERATGRPVGWGASARRNFVLLIPFVPFLILLTLERGRRMGDDLAGTAVVWLRHADKPPFHSLFPSEVAVPKSGVGESPFAPTSTADLESDNPYRAPNV